MAIKGLVSGELGLETWRLTRGKLNEVKTLLQSKACQHYPGITIGFVAVEDV
jgi:hypothetical protein